MIQRGSDTSFTNLWSLLLFIQSLLHYIENAQENKKNTILSYNIAENRKRVKRTIRKPNNSLEQPSSDTFSQTIGKPNNYNVLLIKKPIKPKYRVHYKMIFQLLKFSVSFIP
jgi:hypothetical protein